MFNNINAGIADDSMIQVVGHIAFDVLRYEPDFTTVAFGLHDVVAGLAHLPLYPAASQQGISQIVEHSAVIVLTPCVMEIHLSLAGPLLYQNDAAH